MLINSAISFFVFAMLFVVFGMPQTIKKAGPIVWGTWLYFNIMLLWAGFSPYWTGELPLVAGFHVSRTNAAQMLFYLWAIVLLLDKMKTETAIRYLKLFLFLFAMVDLGGLYYNKIYGGHRFLMDAYTFDNAFILIAFYLFVTSIRHTNKSLVIYWSLLGLIVWMGGDTMRLCGLVGIWAAVYWQCYASRYKNMRPVF